MAKEYIEQVRFSRGEIDPLMIARGDLDVYYAGVSKLHNMLVLRQGGVKSRDGSQYIDSLPVGTHKMITFEANASNRYILVISEGEINVYKNGVKTATIPQTVFTGDKIREISFATFRDTILLFHQELPTHSLLRNSDTNWVFKEVVWSYIPKYPFNQQIVNISGTVQSDKEEGKCVLTAQNNIFNSSHVGQYIEGNGGRARITQYINAKKVNVSTESAFYNDTAVTGWVLITGYEDAWSSSRGYPACGAFYEGRLICAGSYSLPSTIWFSQTNNYFNFDISSSYDDDAIDYTLDSYNQVNNIIPGRSLQIFTTAEEYICVQALDEPITPKNITFKLQTAIGSQLHIPVYVIEGASYFVNGSSLQQFIYNDSQSAYESNIVSIMSGHLIRNPRDLAVRKEYTNLGATFLSIVNEDGSMTMVNILASQDIMGFSDISTNGKFLNAGTDNNSIFVVVEREINGQTVNYIERFVLDSMLDANIVLYNQGKTITGLDHLEGMEVSIVADEAIMAKKTVVNGTIEVERSSKKIEIGLYFDCYVIDMPTQTPNKGPSSGLKKNVSQVVLQVSETNALQINDRDVPLRGFGPKDKGSPLDVPPPYYTGVIRRQGFIGWDKYGQVKIGKNKPGHLSILSLTKKVNVTGFQ